MLFPIGFAQFYYHHLVTQINRSTALLIAFRIPSFPLVFYPLNLELISFVCGLVLYRKNHLRFNFLRPNRKMQ